MSAEVEYNEDWTKEDQERFEAKQAYFLEVLPRMCWETDKETGRHLFAGEDVLKRMEQVFDAAQETVYINGKPNLVYRDFDHYLEIYLQTEREKNKQ